MDATETAVSPEALKAARTQLARSGGVGLLKSRGIEHMKKISAAGVETRRQNKLRREQEESLAAAAPEQPMKEYGNPDAE